MPEGRNAHRSISNSSFIPVPITSPRPSQSSLSSSLSLPQLAQQPQFRNPSITSVTSPPASPGSISLPNNQTSAFASGKATFRSFRNLLPFGALKAQSPGISATPKGRSLSLGRPSLGERKSLSERKVTEPARKTSHEHTPVVLIEASSDIKGQDFLSLTLDQEPLFTHLVPLPSSNSGGHPPPSPPSAPPSGDLSTIMESEISGVSISKHIPLSDDSLEVEEGKTSESHTLTPHAQEIFPQSPDAGDTSAFDLSTSKLADEVRDALSQENGKGDWLGGVVVEDLPNTRETEPNDDRVHNVSFNLRALDPDLAALLSPNRLTDPKSAASSFVPKSIPSPSRVSHERNHSSEFSKPTPPITSETWSSARLSRELTSRQPSPLQLRSSLSGSTSSGSPSSVPRLARPWRADTISANPDPVRSSLGEGRPPSALGAQRSPLSPGIVDEHGSLKRADSTESNIGRSTTSRLGSLARTSTFHYPSSSRPPLRHLTSPTSPWDTDSVSPSSRASSSLGTTASRRFFGSRPSMDSEARSSQEQGRMTPFQNRNRSMSDSRASPPVPISISHRSPLTAAVLQAGIGSSVPGPRTTRLFKAAGLMSNDEDVINRFNGGLSPDRDSRQMAPSRSGYSEISRTSSSWGRARTGTFSESASIRGSTPFSASTAPTTVSASSLQNPEGEIQILKEKHQMETDALLAALYDSQNMNKILREENAGLRNKIMNLEDRNLDLLDQLRRPSVVSSNNWYAGRDVMARDGSLETLYKRSRPPRSQPLFPPPEPVEKEDIYRPPSLSLRERNSMSLDRNSFLDGSVGKRSNKRASISSSVFQAPPSNMSMLNDDDDEAMPQHTGGFPDPDSPSPTLVLSKLQHGGIPHGPSLSSPLGSVSPATANFSSILDSPTSLCLRSDHEDHLGDMTSLDLRADFDFEG